MNINDLLNAIKNLGGTRKIIAIVGAPASGKSTLAQRLKELIPNSAILAMDGFHFDDFILKNRVHLARKGAPHTYDIDGFSYILERVAKGQNDIAVPVFDRSLELSRNSAEIIPMTANTIIVEGNYLLLDDPQWAECRKYYDLTVMINVNLKTIHERLIERWKAYDYSRERSEIKINENDLPNARLVIEQSIPADIMLDETQ